MWRAGLLFLCFTSSPSLAAGDEPPPRRLIHSANRAYVLEVNPATQTHHVYWVWDLKQPRWTLHRHIGCETIVLSNNGRTIAVIAPPTVAETDLVTATGMEFCNKHGVFQSYSMQQLCPTPSKCKTNDDKLVVWRAADSLDQDGRRVWVTTSDGHELKFALADGKLLSKAPATALLTWEKALRHLLVVSHMAQWAGLSLLGMTGVLYLLSAYEMLRFLQRTAIIRTAKEMQKFKRLVARNMFATVAEVITLLLVASVILGGAQKELIVWADAPLALLVAGTLLIATRLLKRLEAKVRAIPVPDEFFRQEHREILRTWRHKQLPDW